MERWGDCHMSEVHLVYRHTAGELIAEPAALECRRRLLLLPPYKPRVRQT